ncbi:MAG: putative aldehyde oxidase, molybdopterin-binding subunit [Rhodanobacteraceae bacterium]|jgi:isoquinoline 1-oxidoreductase beta subunit|nr:MAG: putative aldehyde oxidase, molybdopterin-binding subunit [Rhodanobacteraceae bacterium]
MTRAHDAGRRRFLKVFGTATGALVVGLPALAWTPDELLGQNLITLNPYLRIEPDGTTVIGARDPEVGQGIRTAEARIIAEELDADWNRVIVEPLDLGVTDVGGEPHWTYGHQMASGSTSVPAAWNDLRSVGAAARELLLRAAAARWNIDVANLRTQRGMVIARDGRKLGYGELAEAAAKLKPPANLPAPKPVSQYTLIGQDAGDVDARDIVSGRQHFAGDEWFGDTLVAVIAHCPYPGGTLAHLDDRAALKLDGVKKVLTIPPPSPARPLGTQQLAAAVAVLAEDTWTAMQGVAKLDVRWNPGARAAHGDDALTEAAATALQGQPEKAVRTDGDFATAAKRARHRFQAEYHVATIAHADLELPNALVKVDSQRAVIVAPVQNPRATFDTVQRLTGLAPDKIEIRLPRAGGGFGRFLEADYVAEAVMLAKAAGKPVKLTWTRADAFAHDTFRPFSAHKLEACADRKNKLTGWTHRIASTSRLAGREPRARWWLSEMHPDDLPAGLIDNLQYAWFALDSTLPRGSYRASSHAVNAFATECFIDEIAQGLKQDALKFRLALLGEPRKLSYRGHGGPVLDTGRLSWVLQLAADAIGWSKPHPHGHGFGLACHFTFGGYVAHAVEISMEGTRLVIHNVVCAADLGRVVNPLGARAALVGATLDGFSTALRQRITIKNGLVAQRGFRDYPLATMAQMPHDVQVILVPSQERPTGAFDMGFPSAAPALANAIFAGTTVRVRQLPIWPDLMRLL